MSDHQTVYAFWIWQRENQINMPAGRRVFMIHVNTSALYVCRMCINLISMDDVHFCYETDFPSRTEIQSMSFQLT